MSDLTPVPIVRRTFEVAELMASFPPRLTDPNKKVVYAIACPPGCRHAGTLTFSRWREMPLPGAVGADGSDTAFEVREDVFGYEPKPPGESTVEWYLNFAHFDLFAFYGGPLFAQDEMQVAEHPCLASLREALLHSQVEPLCVENGRPTPALVAGAQRRCAVDTAPDVALGRPRGLYGNHFRIAPVDVVTRATRAIDPPTVTDILAMEAPAYGTGEYTREQIDDIMTTLFTGFSAARIESLRVAGPVSPSVVVHTGFWGCGAYGGNRVLMALLQLLAARLSGLDRLVFHTVDAAGSRTFETARDLFDREATSSAGARALDDVLDTVVSMAFRWGVSDGN